MKSLVMLVSTSILIGLVGFFSVATGSDVAKRQWDSPELAKLVTYWTVFAFRRGEAATRCLMKLNIYTARMGAVDSNKVVRRANPTDVIDAQENADRSENALDACIREIIKMHGADPLYEKYQNMFVDVEREGDRVEACQAAVKGRLPKDIEKSLNKRSVDIVEDLRNSKRGTSGLFIMQRFFNNLKRIKASIVKSKEACFQKLAIPETFPYQLE